MRPIGSSGRPFSSFFQVLPPSIDLWIADSGPPSIRAATVRSRWWVAARGPQRPLRGDVDHVRVPRVDDDLPDVLGGLKPHLLPAPARVQAAVDAVAETDVAPADVLATPHPDDLRMTRVDRDAADGV